MTTIVTLSDEGAGSSGEVPVPLGPLLARAHKAARHLLRRLLEPLGLTPVQAAALARLIEQEDLSLNELAERLQSDAPTVSGVVECLVGAGYVERREDPRDRRRLRLVATEKGRQIGTALREAEEQREAVLTAGLSPTEVAQFKAWLKRVQEAVGAAHEC
jgi:DNA-binding MarR family transcriptional regulator